MIILSFGTALSAPNIYLQLQDVLRAHAQSYEFDLQYPTRPWCEEHGISTFVKYVYIKTLQYAITYVWNRLPTDMLGHVNILLSFYTHQCWQIIVRIVLLYFRTVLPTAPHTNILSPICLPIIPVITDKSVDLFTIPGLLWTLVIPPPSSPTKYEVRFGHSIGDIIQRI